jgi:hypothetical protein
LKSDLGALLLGVIVAGNKKADEMSKSLLGFKDLFLVGFFLTIGLGSDLTLRAGLIGVALLILVLPKTMFFFFLFTRFRVRSFTSLLGSLGLTNYSEFGLIVASLAVKEGWLESEWLATIAIAVSLSFIGASPLNTAAHTIYRRFHDLLVRFESKERLPDDQPPRIGDETVIVIGMGRVGTAAYRTLCEQYGGDRVVGLDRAAATVQSHQDAGRNVIRGDAADTDFWERIRAQLQTQPRSAPVEMVVLAMTDHQSNLIAATELRASDFRGFLASVSRFEDEREELERAGVDAVFDLYTQAGSGFAQHVHELRSQRESDQSAPSEDT